jgi:CheY-like chemotaxis protein
VIVSGRAGGFAMQNHVEIIQPTPVAPAPHRIVVVSNDECVPQLPETILGVGPCDVVFVESTAHAYSQIKCVAPDLIILCLEIDDLDAFQVLSMLKLDSHTREIPVVTRTTEHDCLRARRTRVH